MEESIGTNEFTTLAAEVDRAARDIASSAKLKLARAFSPATTKAADAVEHELLKIRDSLKQAAPARAKRLGAAADRVLSTYRQSAQFATFKDINARTAGAIDSVSLIPKSISAKRAGEIVHELTLADVPDLHLVDTPLVGGGVVPQSKTSRLRVHQTDLHCHEETDLWDEPSSSDEIVLGVNWIAPTGRTGYRWSRREGFDAGETKSVDHTFSWDLPQKGKQQYFMLFTLIEEDSDDAAAYIERVFNQIRGDIHAHAEKFAAWLAGVIGVTELGPIIANILKKAIDYVFGWLISFFSSNVIGTSRWTFTLNSNGQPKWKSTGTSVLPMPMSFKGMGAHYSLGAEALLS